MLTPLCTDLDLDVNDGDGAEIAASIVLAAQCKGSVSRDAWLNLCEKIIKAEDVDGDFDETKPIFWMTKAIGSMLAHDSVGVRKYCSTLDKHFCLEEMWNALQDSNRKVKKEIIWIDESIC